MPFSSLQFDPACADEIAAGSSSCCDPDGSESALLANVLRLCAPDKAGVALCERLLARFGSLSAVLSASAEALELAGLSRPAATNIGLLNTCARGLAGRSIAHRPIINSWNALLDYARLRLRDERREHFHALFLDRRLRLIRDERLGSGTVDHAPVYPREVIRRALELSASALILVHNHPSGDPTPSKADIELTKQLAEAGKLLGITVHDHLIVGSSGVASFKALGLF